MRVRLNGDVTSGTSSSSLSPTKWNIFLIPPPPPNGTSSPIPLEFSKHLPSHLIIYHQVTILFSNFSDEDRALPEAVQYRREINEYNRRYSGVPRPVSTEVKYLTKGVRRDLDHFNTLWPHCKCGDFQGSCIPVKRFRSRLCLLWSGNKRIDQIPDILWSVMGWYSIPVINERVGSKWKSSISCINRDFSSIYHYKAGFESLW